VNQPIDPETQVALAFLLEDSLPLEEQTALEKRIRNEPVVCAAFAALLRQDVLLGELSAESRYLHTPVALVAKPQAYIGKKAWLLASAACIALVLIGWIALRDTSLPTETAVLSLLTGAAQIERNGVVLPAREGMELLPLDGVRVSGVGRTEVRFADGSRISAEKGAHWTWTSAKEGRREILLESGALSALIEKQKPGQSYILNTAQARVTVIGTCFRLSIENLVSHLELYEGAVKFLRKVDAKEISVTAGQRASASADTTQFVTRPIAPTGGTPAQFVRKALLVTAEPLPFYAHDVAIVRALKNLGFEVEVKLFDAVTPRDADGMDVALVSSHKCLGSKVLREVRVPVIAWHNIWHQDLGLMQYDAAVDHQLKLRTANWVQNPPDRFADLKRSTQIQFGLNVYSSLPDTKNSIPVLRVSDARDRSPLVLFPKETSDFAGPRVAFSIDVREGGGNGARVEISEELFAATVHWCLSQKEATK